VAQEIDVVSLTQALIRIPSINPPGDEEACARWLAVFLAEQGFRVRLHTFGERRFNLIAELLGESTGSWLGFSGHLDTVPLGNAQWVHDPFGGEIVHGLLYGRGSTDMKSGVAAFIAACVRSRDVIRKCRGVRLLLTGGEETGCDGALALKSSFDAGLADLGALIVGEPTQNFPYIGHKGALWMRGTANGVTAHGSMPEAGDNAIYKVARAVQAVSIYARAEHHALMGGATVNVGTIAGGSNVNSVPDRATFEVDVRTVPGMSHAALRDDMAARIGRDVDLETFVDVPPLITDALHPWVRRVFGCCAPYNGEEIVPKVVPYFTDGSVLVPPDGSLPAVILGPGEPQMMHKTDEYCGVERLREAASIYVTILADWAAGQAHLEDCVRVADVPVG
jgi:succinyl-diaminopimelate desuccinylase